MSSPELLWDLGTAYDLFFSLQVLHQPADFDIPGAWAAGVRARLPVTEREMLEQSQRLVLPPFHWIYALPEPKDANAALWALGSLPPAERLPAVALRPDALSAGMTDILREVAARGRWDDRDRESLAAASQRECPQEKNLASSLDLVQILNWWSRPQEFGERYLEALSAYHQVFFGEEERRIRPALQAALSRAQELAGQLTLSDLLEELSQGLRFEEPSTAAGLVLAPSFWCTPLMVFGKLSAERELWLFGARPPDASLVPGEQVPDALLRALKALSDPSRLRILHYLADEPLSPAQLSRRLRLRAPTVIHHLRSLRLAGLVQLTVGESKQATRYATRPGAVRAAFDALEGFLQQGNANSAQNG